MKQANKILLGIFGIISFSSLYADYSNYDKYPSCTSIIHVADLANIDQKIVLCPQGAMIAGVVSHTHYQNYALPYNTYCRNILLEFSTFTGGVYIKGYQYYETNVILPGNPPAGFLKLPDIRTKQNTGVIKIKNNSPTSVCIGLQCLD